MPSVVVVKKGDILAVGFADTGISGRRKPFVLLVANTADHRGKVGDNLFCIRFGRAIVDDDNFDIVEALSERRFYRAAEELTAFVGGDDD
ncbi:hypothetical protein GCM10009067_29060 [Haloarcula sebkhae]|uniref:Uncharacterized protein n=1 Tax=Haloarcula sebkhae TaxID=932660 RepID=A0A830ETI2_9EURY|nr:hypothetical protein GCM10009067_29060 [Haloarcula sebkhae]